MAERLGVPLMPWQRLVAEVGGEIDPSTGLPAFREVVVTVPRQSGKSTLILAWMLQRCIGWGSPQAVAYSAQTGQDARRKLINDWVPMLERRRRPLTIETVTRANGNESVRFQGGSRIGIIASGEDAGHGQTIDLAVKDEFFADTDDRRDQLFIPASAARPAAQVLTTSTMGTDASVPLDRVVARGRQAVEDGRRDGIAYFEWSASPDVDIYDPVTWWTFMPALGHTITEPVVQQAAETLTEGEFRRAFGNIATLSDDRVIPAVTWAVVSDPTAEPVGELVFGVDVNVERTGASIVAAGAGVVELVEHRPGMSWLVERTSELVAAHGGRVFADGARSAPIASFLPDFKAAGVEVDPVKDISAASAALYDAIADATVRFRAHPVFDQAVAAASRRTFGDSWSWSRRSSTADISPLVAATVAHHGMRRAAAGPVAVWA